MLPVSDQRAACCLGASSWRAYSARLSLPSLLRSARSKPVMRLVPAASAFEIWPSRSRTYFLNAASPSESSVGRLLPAEDDSFFPAFALVLDFDLLVFLG